MWLIALFDLITLPYYITIYTISHNINTTSCHQNSSDPSRHGLHKTSEGVLWVLAPRHYHEEVYSACNDL